MALTLTTVLRSPRWQRAVVVVLPTCLCLGQVLGLWHSDLVERLDGWVHDQALQLAAPTEVKHRVVIVAIDEKSLADIGPWPWPRQHLQELIQALFEQQGVAAVGLDKVYGEAAADSAHMSPAPTHRSVVVGQYLNKAASARPVSAPIATEPSTGHSNVLMDSDGVVRAVPALVEHGGQKHEALALGVLRRWKNTPKGASVEAKDWVIPFRGALGHVFERVSASDIAQGRLATQTLQGAVVLVGATVPGLAERYRTPWGNDMPTVEIQAHLVSALMDGQRWVRPVWASTITAGLALMVALGAWWCVPRLGWGETWLMALGLWGTVGMVWALLWQGLGWVIPVSALALMVVLILIFKLTWGFARERHVRELLWNSMRRYFPAQRWEAMRSATDSPLHAPLVERELTVMFCDWQGFTALAERVSPQRLQALLHHVLGRITQAVEAQGGTVDKYMGDCVMAFWGAPGDNPHHARDAVQAALNIVAQIETDQGHDDFPELLGLGVTIGIHTGNMLVGDMGSSQRQSYTVVGDAVNVAARLQSQCAEQGVRVLVGTSTAHQTPLVDWTPLGELHLSGRQQAVAIYTPFVINQPERRP